MIIRQYRVSYKLINVLLTFSSRSSAFLNHWLNSSVFPRHIFQNNFKMLILPILVDKGQLNTAQLRYDRVDTYVLTSLWKHTCLLTIYVISRNLMSRVTLNEDNNIQCLPRECHNFLCPGNASRQGISRYVLIWISHNRTEMRRKHTFLQLMETLECQWAQFHRYSNLIFKTLWTIPHGIFRDPHSMLHNRPWNRSLIVKTHVVANIKPCE